MWVTFVFSSIAFRRPLDLSVRYKEREEERERERERRERYSFVLRLSP